MLYKRFATKSFITKTVIVTSIATAMLVPVAQALAWCTDQSASVSCVNGADIHVSFTNAETDKNNPMNVVVKDNQTGQSTDLGRVEAQETKSGDIATGQSTLHNGDVTFYLTWANGQSGHDTRTEGYSSITCQMPTSTPTPTPSETPSETPCVTETPTETPTVTPSETVTPTATPSVTVTPTSGPTPTPIVVTATPTPNNTITVVVQSSTATAPTVQPAPKVQELPKTGAETDILFGLLSLIPVGLKLRKMK